MTAAAPIPAIPRRPPSGLEAGAPPSAPPSGAAPGGGGGIG